MVRPMIIDLSSDEPHYYPFTISVNRFNGRCNTAEDPLGRISVPNMMDDVNLKVCDMSKGIDESRILTKYNSCKCR